MPIRPENRGRYPADWKDIRQRILERAKNHCEGCGVENHTMRDGARIVLTIAHLDHTPEHCADENLQAWCQRCHNRYDVEHRKETRARTRDRREGQLMLVEVG